MQKRNNRNEVICSSRCSDIESSKRRKLRPLAYIDRYTYLVLT